jgi:hypothetical protein
MHSHEMTTSNADHAEVGGTQELPPDAAEDLRRQLAEARRELDRLRNENQQLRGRLGLPPPDAVADAPMHATAPTLFPVSEPEALPEMDARSPLADKVALVRRLFRGQDEVHAVRWTNPVAVRPAMLRRLRVAGTAAPPLAGPSGTWR